ncbi:uncharacterized protein [Dermacentor andersoni]|uniref:uncharacterized protein isoform X1 n=2 Tax=Dermacentor andersoni TaxID=34620 RepID=UPI002416B980|nr:uncharacterized protein LOC129385713 isoform X1 [Dermacentor andersoni]XP_054928681.1 uncharacterized protein LOC129385713 isoform X1 [Dermacentor andersoni]
MTYDPHKGMSTGMLEYYLGITRKNGYHCVLPYGIKFEKYGTFMKGKVTPPLYNGLTFRVFFYIQQGRTTSEVILALNSPDSQVFYTASAVGKGTGTCDGYTANGVHIFCYMFADYDAGDYLSVGIQVEGAGNILKGSLNGSYGKKYTMAKISDIKTWYFKIVPNNNIATSIHVYDEPGKDFPTDGLGSEYFLESINLSVGSYGIFHVLYGAGSGELTIAFNDEYSKKSHYYASTGLSPGDLFTVYIRNTPTGWLLHPSFQATADLVQRDKYHDLISPIFTPASIIRTYLESGK